MDRGWERIGAALVRAMGMMKIPSRKVTKTRNILQTTGLKRIWLRWSSTARDWEDPPKDYLRGGQKPPWELL